MIFFDFEIELFLKLVLAMVLGAVIGLEREVHERPAGLRTHALVCMGSALFAIVSTSFLGPNVDISRIASGVVMGIGFLGAGMIFKEEKKVVGLTTAADLWVLGAVGLAIGTGLYFVALFSVLLVLIVLWAGRYFEARIQLKKKESD